nr:immunoglobulin heavy chain junction region [Macaca mulatta]MOW47306.1 immunoglobulin heavy chain junction region [Macaca mulatta]
CARVSGMAATGTYKFDYW